jgi:integrase
VAKLHKLTAAQVRDAKPGDKLSDGGGLRLDVDKNGNRSWTFRYTSPVTGRERYMGLGPAQDVSLAKARQAAASARELRQQGKDPIDQKREERATKRLARMRGVTFRQCAERLVDAHTGAWKNEKHRQQWRSTLATYVYPVIGDLPVQDIDTGLVLRVLEPIWSEKPETASRIRGRIDNILDWATVAGYRRGENPAVWRGRLAHLLPSKRKVRAVVHHAALPYSELAAFMAALAADTSDAARLLRFMVLTAARYSEAARAEWSEIDLTEQVWNVPAGRMKAGKAHTVPLSAATLEVLGELGAGLIFSGMLTGRPVSDVALANCIKRHTNMPATTHGFRSTFRDWAGDCTQFPREVAEAALAHTLDSKTEAAYRRSSALAKRRELMDAWAAYCMRADTGKVLAFARTQSAG